MATVYRNHTLDAMEATTPTFDNSSLTLGSIDGDSGGFVPFNIGQFGLSKDIRFYGSLVLVVIGLLCNSLTLAVMLLTKLRTTSYGLYLSALAIADSLVLLAEFMKLTDHPRIGWKWTSYDRATCKFNFHVRYSAQLLSAMLVTSITVERFLVIRYPLKMAALKLTKTVKKIIAAEVVVAALLGSYGSILFEMVSFFPGAIPVCLVDISRADIYETCNLYITKVFGEVTMPCIVLVFTLLIIREVTVAARRRRMHLSGGAGESAGQKEDKLYKKSSRSEIQMTIMLLSVAITFIFLRIPYTICWYASHYALEAASVFTNAPLNNATNVTYVLVMANYSINFFLYSLSGGSFREHLKSVLLCRYAGKRAIKRKYTSNGNSKTQMTTSQSQTDKKKTDQ